VKERITITLEQDILEKLDSVIDGSMVKNRSHAIELYLKRCFESKVLKQAVLLVGGDLLIEQEGKDIHPFMATINGETVLEHNIRLLTKYGVEEIIIPSNKKTEKSIRSVIGEGEHLGISVKYVLEKENLGSAGVIKLVSEFLTGPFIVLNTYELKEIDLKEMHEFHKKQKNLATIAITTTYSPEKYGVVVLNGNLVYTFIEKPVGNSPTNLISAGLYIFEPEIIKLIPEGFSRLEVDVFPKLASKENLSGFIFYGKWQDIKSEEDLENAIKYW